MKHKKVTLLQAVDSGNRLDCLVPPGEYYVGDPCYVMSSELYLELHEIIFPNHNGRDVELAIELEDGSTARLIDYRTAHGDGQYDIKAASGNKVAFVDSGGLVLMDRRLCDYTKFDNSRIAKLAGFFTLTDVTDFHSQGGNAFLHGVYSLYTDPPSEDGDDD